MACGAVVFNGYPQDDCEPIWLTRAVGLVVLSGEYLWLHPHHRSCQFIEGTLPLFILARRLGDQELGI